MLQTAALGKPDNSKRISFNWQLNYLHGWSLPQAVCDCGMDNTVQAIFMYLKYGSKQQQIEIMEKLYAH